ncbi:MAG: hypothetical protein IPH04_12275, partial [Saprospirales bacterium]|nr:hypothetical protein [Saprospirales bacterium]
MKLYAIKATVVENGNSKRVVVAIYVSKERAEEHRDKLNEEDRSQRREIEEEWLKGVYDNDGSGNDWVE